MRLLWAQLMTILGLRMEMKKGRNSEDGMGRKCLKDKHAHGLGKSAASSAFSGSLWFALEGYDM